MPKLRAHVYVDEKIWRLFAAMCPTGHRSKTLERLLARWAVENHGKYRITRRGARGLKKLRGVGIDAPL